jgi:hypothetical protein
MTKDIYFIGGSKGGVGKSMVALALLDYLIEKGEDVILIESDTSNPDVWKTYHGSAKSELINLDEADGWIALVNICEQHPDCPVVVNSASRNNVGVTTYGATLNSSMSELERKLVTFWVINRQRDSLELLKEYLETMTETVVHAMRNAHWGEERKFELYNGSKLKTQIEGRGGKSLTFPDLADRVADDLNRTRMSIAVGLKELPLGNRAELSRWRAEVGKLFAGVVPA